MPPKNTELISKVCSIESKVDLLHEGILLINTKVDKVNGRLSEVEREQIRHHSISDYIQKQNDKVRWQIGVPIFIGVVILVIKFLFP